MNNNLENQVLDQLPSDLTRLLTKFWPGPLTIVFNKQGYRIPSNPFLLSLIEEVGPLYSTSANISGQEPIKDLNQATSIFNKNIDEILIVESGEPPVGRPSTIYDYDNKEILRVGSISREEIEKELKASVT